MKKNIFVFTAVTIFLLCVCIILFPIIKKELYKGKSAGPYGALEMSLILALDSYYDDNKMYPDSLEMLSDIEYCDGARPEMLKDFKYVSSKDGCEISYFSVYFGKEIKTKMYKGSILAK